MNINPKYIIESGILIPFKFTQIQQVGIDLTIEGALSLDHGSAKNVLLNEVVKIPQDMFALLYGRSTYNRMGVLIRGSVYDSGYNGQVGCTIYNMSGSLLQIPNNERVCQIVFFKADSASQYQGQYQDEHIK